MAISANEVATNIQEYLDSQQRKTLLRFITCGSVDDGKSTLIGRLLFESKLLFEDQLEQLKAESKKHGTQDGELDFALLVDGLSAEREQGITIDVAYRYFATDKRKFIVADTPGHEQYTRNMATGASTADLAVVMVDARKGILTQTRRHTFIVSMLGVRHVVLAVNKMDLVDYSQKAYNAIEEEYRDFAAMVGIEHVLAVPVSALNGDNILEPSDAMPWYSGPNLVEHLESVSVHDDAADGSFRMPVQWVNRPDLDFRGFCGQVASGTVRPGDRVRILPSSKETTVSRIVTMDGDIDTGIAGQSVTLTLADEVDVSRGDVIATADDPCAVADQFEAKILWMSDQPMLPGRPYMFKVGTKTTTATLAHPKFKVNVNTLEELAAKKLELNEIGVCNVALEQDVAFDPYESNRTLGSFILIDRMTNNTVGMGLLNFALRRASNIHWHKLDIDKVARAQQKRQRAAVLWFTGLSGSGKSTIANVVESKLHAMNHHTAVLDGDNVRHGLNRDLGFTDADRVENIRRVAEVSKLMLEGGLLTLVSFISPFRSERQMARKLLEDGEFIEVFVDTPISVAEQRDPKGLYKKAREGQIKNFTGIDSPYEAPRAAEVRIDTTNTSAEDAADQIIGYLEEKGYLGGG